MVDRLCLCVCENIEQEARAVLTRNDPDFDGVTLAVFPGRCGRPPLSADELRQLAPKGGVALQVVGSACLSALRRKPTDAALAGLNHVTHCFHLFADHELVERLLADGSYLLTPGWLAHWRERIACWGFAEDDLRGFLREAVNCLHLLDTGVNADTSRLLREFSAYAQREHTTTAVGLDFFALFLKTIVLRSRLQLQSSNATDVARRLNKKTADYAMALDLLSRLATQQDEQEAIRLMLEVFTMLFAPQSLRYVVFEQGSPVAVHELNAPVRVVDDDVRRQLATRRAPATEGTGVESILVPVTLARQVLGVVIVAQIAFPEYGSHYRALIDAISPICGLSIGNARAYEELRLTGEALHAANKELARLASIDGLTQLPNRRHFDERLDAEWRRAKRQSSHLSLIMIDIDQFKAYNDLHGHPAGDRCLKDVGHILSSCIARAGDLAARYGGEEFAVVLPCTTAEGAGFVANRLREAILDARIEHGASTVSPYVTLSIGHATIVPAFDTRVEALVRLADQALYEAKRQGRNRCCAGQ